jgi:membrane-associated phospholipid phosphatase
MARSLCAFASLLEPLSTGRRGETVGVPAEALEAVFAAGELSGEEGLLSRVTVVTDEFGAALHLIGGRRLKRFIRGRRPLRIRRGFSSRRRPMATPLYDLPGTINHPQVEPSSGFWLRCPILHTVRLKDLLQKLGTVPPYPAASQPAELAALKTLHSNRKKPVPNLSQLLTRKIFYDPAPAGAVLRNPKAPIRTGVELATVFEAETPGLWHRQVLNVILDPRVMDGAGTVFSPPRQALIWAALDVAIVSALSAAWHLKWVGGPGVEYRQRPFEYASDQHIAFDVLFDLVPAFPDRTKKRPPDPSPSPGTPRHPAYPSGHSTYSAAASRVLGCLFDGYKDPRAELAGFDWKVEFERLADNIGVARLYGGVHWQSDHDFGRMVGEAVGDLVIAQLNRSGIQPRPTPEAKPPKPNDLDKAAKEFGRNCGEGEARFCGNFAPMGPAKMQVDMCVDGSGGP